MLTKLLAIAWKDIYTTYKDRNAMIYMFAMPLALSTIIGLALGTGGDVDIDEIPVAIANQDEGELGTIYENAFVPTGDGAVDSDFATIHDLIDGETTGNVAAAKDEVEDGDLAALIEIPDLPEVEDFFAAGRATSDNTVKVYYDSGRSVGPSVVISILHYLTNGMNTVILAERVANDYLTTNLGMDQDAARGLSLGIMADAQESVQANPPIYLNETDLQGETRTFDMLQYFAPSMAILFMTFTMAAGSRSILNEQNDWTLQRIITTPTPRALFMGGKLLGTYLTGVLQMLILMVATTVVAQIMGRESSVWGTNYAGLVLLVLMVSFAATSLGLLIAALSETAGQADTYSTVALWVLGMLGGSFIPIEGLPDFLGWLPKITLNYWGIQGFFDLSYNAAELSAIATNLLALAVMGAVFFPISVWRFNRRLDL